MSLKNSISSLYRVSGTPGPESPEIDYPIDKIEDILSASSPLPTSQLPCLDVVLFLLRLFDTPSNLSGAGFMPDFADPTISYFIGKSNIPKESVDIISECVKAWFAALKDTKRTNAKLGGTLTADVDGTESLIYRFHLEASEIKDPRRNRIQHLDQLANKKPANVGLSTLYCSFSPRIHYCIRRLKKKKFKYKTNEAEILEGLQEYLYAARCFFYFMPDCFKNAQRQPESIPRQYINTFVEQYDYHINGHKSRVKNPDRKEFFEISSRARLYLNKFLELVKANRTLTREVNTEHFPIDYQATVFTYDFADQDMEASVYGNDDIPQQLKTVYYQFAPFAEEGTEGEYHDESPIMSERLDFADEKDSDIVKSKPNIKRSWLDFVDLRKYFFWWDSAYLQLWHYGRLYQMLYSSFASGRQCQHNVISAFLMVLMHTGMNIRHLAQAKISALPSLQVTKTLLITRKGDRFILATLSPIQRTVKEKLDGCIEVSEQVRFPLPSFLDHFLDDICPNHPVNKEMLFSYIDDEACERRIDLTMIRDFLKSKEDSLGFKCTLELIRSSFFPLYCSFFGLDPLHACYISGNHYGIFHAPLHYVYILRSALDEDYDNVSTEVDRAIRDYSDFEETEEEDFMSDHRARNRMPIPVSRGGYGPSRMPKRESLRTIINQIREKIVRRKIDEYNKRHNLFMVYLYIGLMLATGLRPRNNPDIPWDGFNKRLGVLILSDKLSPKFYEERVVPVVSPIDDMIDDLRKEFKEFSKIVSLQHEPSFAFQPDQLFFLFDNNYKKLDFTLANLKVVLGDEGIAFPYPLNAPRHCLRTAFHDGGVHHELSAMFMGHIAAGKEWLAGFSAVDFDDCEAVFKKTAAKNLTDYGYRKVPYLPLIKK